MHYNVEPLRTDQEIDDFLWAVSQARYGERNRMIVLVGINTGLRMSDILRLKVGQVRGKDRVMIMEQKTGKKRWLFLKNLKTELAHFTRYRGANEPLFCSGRGGALTVNGVYRSFRRPVSTWSGMILVRTRCARRLAIIIIKRLVTLPD
ncbi:integrase [Lactiplantibacillus plantarum 2165]|nr:integrase [Lactiplantibacillus plantarum 2165]